MCNIMYKRCTTIITGSCRPELVLDIKNRVESRKGVVLQYLILVGSGLIDAFRIRLLGHPADVVATQY
jgi:hypothetical protein